MEFEVFKRHILRVALSTDMASRGFAMGEAKEVL